MNMKKIKWYYYLYGLGLITAGLSVGLISSYTNSKIDNGLQELYQLRENYTSLQQENILIKSDYQSLVLIETELNQNIVELNNKVLLIEEELQDKNEVINILNNNVDEKELELLLLESQYEDRLSIKNDEIDGYISQIQSLQDEIKKLQRNNTSVSNNVVELSSISLNKDNIIIRLEEQIKELELYIQNIDDTVIADKNEIISGLTQTHIFLNRRVNSLIAEVAQLTTKSQQNETNFNYLKEIIKLYHVYNMRSQPMQTINTWRNNLNNNPDYYSVSTCIKREYGVVLQWYDEANAQYTSWAYPNSWTQHDEMKFNC